MSIWVTKKEPGNRTSIFTITIPWEALPLLIILFGAAVIAIVHWLKS